jgi:ABC-2 type transport system ATP-binding protein
MGIKVVGLIKEYQGFTLSVPELVIGDGETIGLVGNNGSGKTTLLRLLLDLIETTRGEVFSQNMIITEDESWKSFTAAYLGSSFVIDFLSVMEYFDFVASCYALSDDELASRLTWFDDFLGLPVLDSGRKKIRELSTGGMQKVGIAAAILPNPQVLILDEPFSNLDPTSQVHLVKLLKKQNAENLTTTLISSHDIDHIADICTRVILLEGGGIVADLETDSNTSERLRGYFSP